MASVTYEVAGMTCEHCSRAVSAELTSLTGVTDVRVDLVPDGRSSVLVVSEAPLAVEAVEAALDEAGGYRLAAARG
jgi:copper chaperone